MIKLYVKGRGNSYFATGEYDGKGITILKGSTVSPRVASKISPIVMKIRNNPEYVNRSNRVIKDIYFRSPSTAANFVTGNMSNGLMRWKNGEGISLKQLKSSAE